MKIESKLVHVGNKACKRTGAINAPIYLSTAYGRAGLGDSAGFDYIRSGSPTRGLLEEAIADLEDGDRGFACSSGMAAIQIVLSLFYPGDEIICTSDLYGGTYRLFEKQFKRMGITFKYVDTSCVEGVRALITDATKAIFVETPTNPMMIETDLDEINELAKAYDLLFIVDNPFLTPFYLQPLRSGADVVLHSATKYLGGHNDVLAGLIVTKGDALGEEVHQIHKGAGAVLGAMDAYQVMRGMKTLALRMEKHTANAKKMVAYLAEHESVTDVYYAGRGGMVSFKIQAEQWVDPFLRGLSLITFAESLGGVESFITYPTTQTHADVPLAVRESLGVCGRLLRFSVGIEDTDDLIADLERAFGGVAGV